MLNLKNVNKIAINSKKQKVNTLSNIFLEIRQGDFVCIQGANGAGKSALLSIIGAEDTSFNGEYFIDGIELSKYTSKQLQELKGSRFGIVPEKADLIAKRTIEQNLELPLRISRLSKEERKNAIVKAVNSVGLSDKILTLKPIDLSSGQCQRVMIARAIITNPQVIIADNPTALMDEESSDLILNLFTALNKGGVTIVVASRDENFLRRAKRVFTMSRGMLVENMKVTRGKNVGEVIDIDTKKKKAQKPSIKKHVIVPEKKGKVQKNEPTVVENPSKIENLNENKKEEIASEITVKKPLKSNTKSKESELVDEEKNNSTKKILAVSSSRKKKNNDDNQLTFDEFVVPSKDEEKVEEEKTIKTTKKALVKKDIKETTKTVKSAENSSKKIVDTKKSEEQQLSKKSSSKSSKESKKAKEEIKTEEDSELLIKPVKSSKRKTK